FFLRFAPQLKARGARIVYRPGSHKLKFLFEQMPFLDDVLRADQCVEEGAAYWAFIGDLPLLLGMKSMQDVPPPVPIHPPAARVAAFHLKWLQDLPPPYIGVTWRAGTVRDPALRQNDEIYSKLFKELPMEELAESLRGFPGTLVILQRKPADGEVQRFAELCGGAVLDCSDLNEDLEEMVAALYTLDDMVGVSNTNYHLRAGLGLKGRVLAPKMADYRWMSRGDASPWFPGYRVYREDFTLGWKPALAEMRHDLDEMARRAGCVVDGKD
ncbi:MAG: hypothetical protein HZC24_13965, partial [Rhodocyclales bacterium]|nr:hypothetical protein [Rhodocyclales bacterium]